MAAKRSTKKSDSGAELKENVSGTDQAFLGATSMSDEELEAEKNFNGTLTTGNVARDNSVYAGSSAPKTWAEKYRENATHLDIRQGVKPDKPEKAEKE